MVYIVYILNYKVRDVWKGLSKTVFKRMIMGSSIKLVGLGGQLHLYSKFFMIELT